MKDYNGAGFFKSNHLSTHYNFLDLILRRTVKIIFGKNDEAIFYSIKRVLEFVWVSWVRVIQIFYGDDRASLNQHQSDGALNWFIKYLKVLHIFNI